MIRSLALLALLALAPLVSAQEIVGVTAFERDTAAEYRFEVPTGEGERVITFWRVPETLWWRQYGDTVVLTGKPGRYTLRVDAIVGSDFLTARPVTAALPVEILGPPDPVPEPEPGPGPTPDPEPEPPNPLFSGVEYILILHESSRQTGREVFWDPMVRDTMDQVSGRSAAQLPQWRIWDMDSNAQFEPAWQPTLTWAMAQPEYQQLPAAFLLDKEGRGVAFPLPSRPEEMIAKLNEYEGR